MGQVHSVWLAGQQGGDLRFKPGIPGGIKLSREDGTSRQTCVHTTSCPESFEMVFNSFERSVRPNRLCSFLQMVEAVCTSSTSSASSDELWHCSVAK